LYQIKNASQGEFKMKVSEAIKFMSKSYLNRIVDSFTKDFSKQSESQARDTIIKNLKELADLSRIKNLLNIYKEKYHQQILQINILESLLNNPDHTAEEEELFGLVEEKEKQILKEAMSDTCFQYADNRSLDILKTVLGVAIEDNVLSSDELRLIKNLRNKLKLSENEQFLLLAQLNHYPQAKNKLHDRTDFSTAILNLQKRGVVFYCNKFPEGPIYVIPQELVTGVKAALGFELSKKAYKKLLDKLNINQLKKILGNENVKTGGKKPDLIRRIIDVDINPSDALNSLPSKDLYILCKRLPGAQISGTKQDKIDRIINYFSELIVKKISEEGDPREIYYEYLTELASRDRRNLLANNVIKKDKEMDNAFEEGTRYLFEKKLGLKLEKLPGTNNPDGSIAFGKYERFMWDNKSKENVYVFPQSHLRQFKSYIRDSKKRVSCFLIIVPGLGENIEENAYKLKVESQSDTDVALITAEDLKWVAENWKKYSTKDKFDLEVFNITGVLTRSLLSKRMELF